ncbi:hypothetical protein [Pikeienuella sp. HZG-20]|uniref:hypothetical protein n=1 Tax=Paludibacillus litoralis TaxID=3133267 RepID=UPI0030ED7615
MTNGNLIWSPAIFGALLLSACVEYGLMEPIGPIAAAPSPADASPAPPEASPPPTASAAPTGAGAPVFRIADLPAEWDGEETAGGLWVALPYLPAYRRVLVTDPRTGRAVVAKLYWRDPGANAAEAVVSSGAAAALGMKPGRETRVDAVVMDDE